ncbi:unnamed protein product [Coffea canephora]|uniref:beta-galactosidase n=1 Tax=Coffea canephora TaxID=49390 RepID=A0A068VFG6_COFCA|nr:unnamed protein product [Coffea canephora]
MSVLLLPKPIHATASTVTTSPQIRLINPRFTRGSWSFMTGSDSIFIHFFPSLLDLEVYFLSLWEYHGGTNLGRIAGGQFIATSYDYDAPLHEYGM